MRSKVKGSECLREAVLELKEFPQFCVQGGGGCTRLEAIFDSRVILPGMRSDGREASRLRGEGESADGA